MSKKRTKAQKKKAAQSRTQLVSPTTLVGLSATEESSEEINPSQFNKQTLATEKPLIRTETRLIKRDLLKSMFVSLLLFGLLLGIYLVARYNVISLPFLS